MVVVSPAGPEGPRRLAAAGAARVLVLGDCPAEPGLEVLPGPLEPARLPLRDASVDAVVSLEAFEALAPAARRELLAEARRVLRRAGLLAVGCPADDAALWQAEDDLRALFPHVAAFAELAWQGVSLAPVLSAAPGSSPAATLREGLLDAPLPARRYLLLASAEALEAPLGECVIVPLAPVGDRPAAAIAAEEIASPSAPPISPPSPSAPPAIAPPVVAPPPLELGDPPDLDDLFGDVSPAIVPGISPPIAPTFAPPAAAPAASDPALLAELERLRGQVAGFAGEREAMVARAARLAGDLERSREEKARTEAELHAARLQLEALQRVPEDSRVHSLADLALRAGLPGSTLAAHELVDEVAPLVAPEPARATADAALDRNRLREELARRTAELQSLETRVLQQEEELRREHLENVRLVTDVDRLREQVERSRAIELERVQELERLGHELRKMEVAHAELQGLYTTQEQRLRARGDDEADLPLDDDDPAALARGRVDMLTAERDQLRARERASVEVVRRRDRELADATRTIRELRRSVEDHASIAAELRGELAVLQVHVQRLEETVPTLQERLRDQQRKTLDREEEAGELQRRLEEGVAEQEHLRGRLRRLKSELDAVASAKQGAEVELFRLRRELEAKHEAIDQLQQIVALGASRGGPTGEGGALSDAAKAEVLRLRSTMAEQAAEHAEALARSEAEHQRIVEGERGRLRRVRLEAAIRAEEMEYLLYQLDTAEQRIWEMSDAEGRAAARLAAGLAQLEKQKEQYDDLADELDVTRNLLVGAQAKIAELERLLDNERARLARVSLVPAATNVSEGSGSFEVSVDEPELEVEAEAEAEPEELVAPAIQRDPDEADRFAGINFDDDGPEETSLVVRLAGAADDETPEVDLASLASAEVSGPRFQLPSDDIDIDDEDNDELAPPPPPPRVVVVPDEDDEDDDEVFAIDTDWSEDEDEDVRPTRPPPRPAGSAPPADREPSNARIVIEVLEDEAWPEDEGGEQPR